MGEVDEYGMPLESAQPDLGYSDDPYTAPAQDDGGDSFADIITNGQDAMRDIFLGLFDAVESVGTGAQDTVSEVAGTAAGVVTNAQDTLGGAWEDTTEAANPWNLAGLGFGATAGGLLATVGVGLVAGFAADQLFFGGTGTASLAKRFAGSRRR